MEEDLYRRDSYALHLVLRSRGAAGRAEGVGAIARGFGLAPANSRTACTTRVYTT